MYSISGNLVPIYQILEEILANIILTPKLQLMWDNLLYNIIPANTNVL